MRINWTPPKIESAIATYHSSADYSIEVHEGDRSRGRPPRRWVDAVLTEQPPVKQVVEHFQVSGDINLAFEQMADDFLESCRSMIQSVVWYWPRMTRRSDGSIVQSPRDIVDTGHLLETQSITVRRL